MCVTDVDCPGNLACYSGNVAWAPPVLVNGSFCDCSMRYGQVRDSPTNEWCTIPGPQTAFNFVVQTLMILVVVGLLLYGAFSFLALKSQNKLVWNDTSVTAVGVMLLLCVHLVLMLLEVIAQLQPLTHTVFVAGAKSSPLEDFVLILIGLWSFIGSFSLSNVPLIWFSIVIRTKNFSLSSREAAKVKFGLRVFQGVLALSVLISMFAGGNFGYFLAAAIVLLGQVAIFFIFVVARIWIKRMLNERLPGAAFTNLLLRRIDVLTLTVLCCVTLSCAWSVVYSLMRLIGTERFCQVGSMCIELIAVLAMFMLLLCAQVACGYYCRLSLGLTRPLSFTVETSDSSKTGSATYNGRNDRSASEGSSMVV